MSKKAQVNEQFNWLFALIAGGVILMFFIFVIVQVKGASDAKIAATVINNFDGMLTGTLATPDSITILDSSPSITIDISCEADGISEISIPDTRSKLDITQKLVFTPGPLNGDYYYSYVKPIETPFYLGNAILLVDSKTIFIVYDPTIDSNGNGDDYLNEMFELLPDNITKVKTPTLDQDRFKSFRKLIIITKKEYYDDPAYEDRRNLRLINSKDSNIIQFHGEENNLFFNVSKVSKKVQAFEGQVIIPPHNSNDFLLYMFFSQNFEYYMCNYDKIVRKTRVVAQIYEKRAEYLMNDFTETGCGTKYGAAKNDFDQMIIAEDPVTSGYPISLEGINQGLLLASCPLIY